MIASSPRSVQRWLIDLREARCIEFDAPSGECNQYNLGRSRQEMIEAGAFLRAPLIAWDKPWHALDRRVWLVLWSYAGAEGVCFPGVTRIADECGVHPRKVREALRRLRRNGLVRQEYRLSQTCLFFLRKHDGWSGKRSRSPGEKNSPRTSAQHTYDKNGTHLRHERQGTYDKIGTGDTAHLAGDLRQKGQPILSTDLETEQEKEQKNELHGAIDQTNGAIEAGGTVDCDEANPTKQRRRIQQVVEQLNVNHAYDATGNFEARRADQRKGLMRLQAKLNRARLPEGFKP